MIILLTIKGRSDTHTTQITPIAFRNSLNHFKRILIYYISDFPQDLAVHTMRHSWLLKNLLRTIPIIKFTVLIQNVLP